jgi:hypothetical protein
VCGGVAQRRDCPWTGTEAVIEPLEDLRDPDGAHPDGGQLDGERDAVQAATHANGRGRVRPVDRESRIDRGGPILEEC